MTLITAALTTRFKRLAWVWAIVVGALCTPLAAQTLVTLPAVARVVDRTGTLTPDQTAALDRKLAAFEMAHGSQIAVVIVPTTQPEPIEVFGNRLGEAWKIGRRDIGDGVLLIVAKEDKRVRIEVARTLEGAIPDARAKQIIRETIGPAFGRGEFYAGIDAALDRLFGAIEGEALPTPPTRSATSHTAAPQGGMLGALVPLFLVALFAGTVLRAMLGRFGAVLTGMGAAGAAVLLVGLPLLIALGLGLVVAAVVLAVGSGGRGGLPLVIGPGWGSGGGSGGGASGGGWTSGGGGDFSGGGASGSWE